MGTGSWVNSEYRGQSSTIGLVLVLGMVILATTTVVVIGGIAIEDSQEQLGTNNAENTMTQLDSQASLVALNSSNQQQIELSATRADRYAVNGSKGRINVSYEGPSGTETLMNTTMGAVTYEASDGARVAYQGGGVWRSDGDSGSVMVSPPEFHYRGATLTLPIVTINNNASLDSRATISRNRTTNIYPTSSLSNPLNGESVKVNITSEYHEGWYSYFDRRAEGTVEHYPDEQRVVLTLTVPVTHTFDEALGTTNDLPGAVSNPDGFENIEEVDAEPADFRIQSGIDDCEANGCLDLSSEASDGTLEGGTYYHDGNFDHDETTYNTNSGDIEIYVNGNLDFVATGGGTPNYEITGSNDVTFYVKGDVEFGGNTGINTNGDPDDLLIVVHSSAGTVTAASGTPQFTGLIYAPGSDFVINGGGNCGRNPSPGPPGCEGNVVGSVVAQSADGGGSGYVNHDGTISRELQFESASSINYLHVSNNSVNVTG